MSNTTGSVLITGADGFIGSHLTEKLLEEKYDVRALVWYNSFGHHGWLDRINPDLLAKLEIVVGDIRDPHSMLDITDGADVVVHLASLIGIPYSYQAPDSYVQTNVTGTLNLLQAARRTGVRRFIHTSTSEVYGTAQSVPMNEQHPLSAQSPYAASKIAGDQLASSFHLSYDLPVTTIRPFNTFGPRQSTRAVIPAIISQLLSDPKKIQLGRISPRRDFTFVEDIADGYVAALRADEIINGEIINIGSGTEISIKELAHRIANLMNSEIRILSDSNRERPVASEVDRLLCDNTRARTLLGWKPSYSLDDGLKETIEWFSSDDNLLFTKQITEYSI